MVKDIAFSVYAVTDMGKARAFYEEVLGLVPSGEFPENESWVEYGVGTGTLAIGSSPAWKPSQDGAVVALEVDDFAKTIDELKAKNAVFVLEPSDYPTCHMAVIADPDKNKVLIHKKK